jgi:hypothetical protein
MRVYALIWQACAQVSHLEVWFIHRVHRNVRLSLPLLAMCSVKYWWRRDDGQAAISKPA